VASQILRAQRISTQDAIREFFEKFLHGVVVTKEENAKLDSAYRQDMPSEFLETTSSDYCNCFMRYERCGIDIVEMQSGWWREAGSVSIDDWTITAPPLPS
jgi:hypothetical protein